MFVSRPVCVWIEIAIFFDTFTYSLGRILICCLKSFIPDTIAAAFYTGDRSPSVREYAPHVKTAWHKLLFRIQIYFYCLKA